MKLLRGRPFDQWRDRSERVREFYGVENDAPRAGAFNVPLPNGTMLYVIASDGFGWDHISISVPGQKRCPYWEEMQFVKRAFFARDEWAIEFHPPEILNVNDHPFCLHLWRCQHQEQPIPAPSMVGRAREISHP